MPDIYRLGACTVYQDGASCIPQASTQRPLDDGEDESEVEDLGQVPIACALGVTALPAPPDDNGSAEGVVLEGVGSLTGTCTAAWDVRCADVVGQMSPGDTALHGTHPDATKRSRVFCKNDLAAIIVGNDMVFSLDRGGKAITLNAWGNLVQITPSAVKISQGTSAMSWIELKGGAISLVGAVNIGGVTALPLVQSAGLVTALGALATAMNAIGGSPVNGNVLGPAVESLASAIGTSATTKQSTGA
jgi:hypothetical protein